MDTTDFLLLFLLWFPMWIAAVVIIGKLDRIAKAAEKKDVNQTNR